MRPLRGLDTVQRQTVQAWRALARRPRLTFVAIVTLAVPMALACATFALVQAILLRPLPVEAPERLVRVRQLAVPGHPDSAMSLSPEVWRRWREGARSGLVDIAAATGTAYTVGGGSEPERLPAARVSANFFSVLGLQPALGRDFRAGEDAAGGERVVIVGDAFWRTRLGGAAEAIGSRLLLDGEPVTVIGVLPPRVRHPYDADLFVPLALPPGSDGNFLYAPARLQSGVTLEQAREELDALARGMGDLPPGDRPQGAQLTPLRDELVGDLRGQLLVLAAGAGLVLLMAAVNLANVYLAQHRARQAELAVRLALGGGRRHLAGAVLAESVLLALLAALAALPLAAAAMRGLLALAPFLEGDYASPMNEFDNGVRLDLPTLAFTFGCAVAVGLLFGLAPALRAGRTDVRGSLTLQRVGLDRREHRALRWLVVGEIAVAVVVVATAGLVLSGFRNVMLRSPGFAAEGVQVFEVNLPRARYAEPEAIVDFLAAARERVAALPGVTAAGVTTIQPFDPGTSLAGASSEALPAPDPPGAWLVNHRQVLPGYLAALGVPLLRGRDLDDRRAGAEPEVVVSDALARRLWPGANAVGQRLKVGRLDEPTPWLRVVGVAADVRESADPADGEVVGTWYVSYRQLLPLAPRRASFVVRGDLDAPAAQAAVRAAIRGPDRDLAVGALGSMEALRRGSLATPRFTAALLAVFGGAGLLLTAIGIYGLLAHWVAQRGRELAVRSALGCAPARLRRGVLREGATLMAAGGLLGGVATLALARGAAAALQGARHLELGAAALALLLLAVVAALAAWAPARRAAATPPWQAMRGE
jgi:putative ABC transport system permease protein